MTRRAPLPGPAALLVASALCCDAAAQSKPPSPAASSAPPAASATPAAPVDPSRPLFEQGVAAHDAGKLPEAEALFARALAAKRSWDIAANLGIVERKLGKHPAAAQHLWLAVQALPPSESDTTRDGLARELAALLSAVGAVTVKSPGAGAEIRVDGALRGTTPLDAPLFLAPGEVTVEVSAPDHDPASRRLLVKAGSSTEITLAPVPRPRPVGRSWAAPAVAFGFGGAGLVTGAIAGTFAAVRLGELRAACGTALVCPDSARGGADDGKAAANVATVGFVAAGLGAAVGLTLIAVTPSLTSRRAPAAGTVSRAPAILLGPTFIGVGGSF